MVDCHIKFEFMRVLVYEFLSFWVGVFFELGSL